MTSSHSIFSTANSSSSSTSSSSSSSSLSQLEKIADWILCGGEKEIEKALDLVTKNHALLDCYVEGTDHLGRRVGGKLLQIAAMAGDFDLTEGIKEEKKQGLVERLAKAGQLSAAEVAEQITEVMASAEAIQENEKRNQDILAAIKTFGEDILKVEYRNDDFADFQQLCQPLINQLEEALMPDSKKVIKAGYIFDPKILHDAAKWFEDNAGRFCWQKNASAVFWIDGFRKLQNKLSGLDALIVREGIGHCKLLGQIPARSLPKGKMSAGVITISGHAWDRPGLAYGTLMTDVISHFSFLYQAKNRTLHTLCSVKSVQNRL